LQTNSRIARPRVTRGAAPRGSRATYVYCVIANRTAPAVRRGLKRLPHAGPVRAVAVDRGLWLIVSGVPLGQYGEAPLAARLSDLDWVSRVAVAHERVVESFAIATAVLPMKLFTIFSSDDRAIAHIEGVRSSVDALIARVARHDEWGVRVLFSPEQGARSGTAKKDTPTGIGYLRRKKAQRDQSVERTERASGVVAALYDGLAQRASHARRRTSSELPAAGGALLLDAALLVPRARAAQFRSAVAREARALADLGYRVSLTGPWPPYSFLND
jgi:hypothetical protein